MIHIDRPLPPTKTWAVRRYRFVSPAGDCLGRLTVWQHKKVDGPAELDVYILDEFRDESLPRGWRSFFYSKQTGTPTEKEPGLYQVNVDVHGVVLNCTCMGSAAAFHKNPCKHKDTLTDLLTVGLFTFTEPLSPGELRSAQPERCS